MRFKQSHPIPVVPVDNLFPRISEEHETPPIDVGRLRLSQTESVRFPAAS